MKFIQKIPEPQQFTQWKHGNSPDWVPSWDAMDGSPIKRVVKDALLREQGGICCYCGIGIRDDDSHIDHFRPRHGPNAYPQGELDYRNLHASCIYDRHEGAKPHCGMKKGSWFNVDLLISPLDPACETQFAFTAYGDIGPRTKGDEAAETTITKLGLRVDFLKKHRAMAIEASGLLDQTIDASTLRAWADTIMQATPDGRFIEFCFAISYVLKNYT
jgi:uncharacterized protein (TIGR02646 family)